MKINKNKKVIGIFFLSLFFILVANNSFAADCRSDEIKDAAGNCVCDVANGKTRLADGYCGIASLAQENAISVGVNEYDQTAGTAAQGQTLFGRTSQSTQPQTKQFKYTLLESFPGFFQAKSELTDLPTMILAIYKFGIWTIGIAGLFMLVVGGFMYMASAGNTSTASNARGIIWDALLGIVAALGAYLILYVINPDLTKLNISFTKVDVEEVESVPAGGSILAEGRLTDVVARQNLSAAGISVNKANCSSPQATNCTSLEGIPAITISNLIALKNACKQFNASCSFVVTGGTEAGHKSHGSGNPMIDIREDAVVTSFLKDVKAKKQYANYAIGQVCTVSQNNLSSISYNHSYEKTCQDPSSVPHFHFSFSG